MQESYDILNRLSDKVLAYAELKNDLLFNKIPKDKICYYINQSLWMGKDKAIQYKHMNLQQMCHDKGLKIEVVAKSGKFYGVRFRAEINFSKRENVIKIYKDSLEELMDSCNRLNFSEDKLTYEDILNIHLAHEFYHYLEYAQGKYTNEMLDKVDTIDLGFYKKKATILKCSEIAAHMFCKELLGLKYLPNFYDYLYLIDSGKTSLKNFEMLIDSLEKELT